MGSSSLTRDQHGPPAFGAWSLSIWTTGEVPLFPFLVWLSPVSLSAEGWAEGEGNWEMGNGESHFICDILFYAKCSFTEFINFVREQVDNGK